MNTSVFPSARQLSSLFSSKTFPKQNVSKVTRRNAFKLVSKPTLFKSVQPLYPNKLPVFNKLYKSLYTTDTLHANASIVNVEVDNTFSKITLPLPSGGQCCFPLKPHETVRQLIKDIRQEDPKIDTLVLRYTSDGLRVSHSTTIDDLLRSEFVIEINNNQYKVPVHTGIVLDEIPEGVFSVNDLKSLMYRAYFQRIRKRLEEDPRHHIPHSEFISWCEEYGLTQKESKNLLRALHYAGIVLHFKENPDLNAYIFLRPEGVFSSITEALDLRYIRTTDMNKFNELATLKEKFLPLDNLKNKLDASAIRYATWNMRIGFIGLAALFAFLARLVWIDFNWDIMEPITYFVYLSTLIISYTFFVLTKQDYTYPELKKRISNRRRRKLYLDNGFNWKKWNQLNLRIQELETRFGLQKPSNQDDISQSHDHL